MTETTRARPAGPRTHGFTPRRIAATMLLALLRIPLSVVLERLIALPPRVERLTFENPTPYDLAIEATNSDRTGWVPVTNAGREETTAAFEVVDQGDTWIFRFASQGEDGGELRVSRGDLERAGWKVVIPQQVGVQLRERGAPPSP